MKDYEKHWSQRRRDQKHFQEKKIQSFRCRHCHAFVVIHPYIGTKNRNHCNFCLWSRHVDIEKGDRASDCLAGMQPIGLTMKREGFSRWGELMIIHICLHCEKISINRIAGDDDVHKVMRVFENSLTINKNVQQLVEKHSITILKENNRQEVKMQLFGM